jgi:hypothetical protein
MLTKKRGAAPLRIIYATPGHTIMVSVIRNNNWNSME